MGLELENNENEMEKKSDIKNFADMAEAKFNKDK